MKIFTALIFIALLLTSFDDEDYKSLFNNGITLLNKNKYDGSLTCFKKSYAKKVHSKTAYYISLCYFYLYQDSLARIYAKKALLDPPRIDTLKFYSDRLNTIIDKCDLRTRFKGVHIKVIQDNEKEEVNSKVKEQLQSIYWGIDGVVRMQNDFFYAQTNELPHASKNYVDSCNSKYYNFNKLDTATNKFRKRNYIEW